MLVILAGFLVAQKPTLVLADSLELVGYQVKVYSIALGEGEEADVMGTRLFLLRGGDTLLTLGDNQWPFLFLDKDTGEDIDGDGNPDVVVIMAGEETMKLVAYSLAPFGPREIIFSIPGWAEIVSYEDVNGDEVPELLVADKRVERFEGLEVPWVTVALRKSRGGYWEEFPEAYAEYYTARLEGLLAKIRMEANPFKKRAYATAYSAYLFHMGKTQEAWDEFLRLTDGDQALLMKFKERMLFWEEK
ncbi:MAG: FG-GAP repeat domain-containing protein [candidate division WOR-3 bacterium]